MRSGTKMAFLVVALGLAVEAKASLTVYHNASDYQAATTGLTTIDFNGIASSGGFVSYGNGPLTLSGVDFTSNGSMFVIDPGFYGSPYGEGGFLNSDFTQPNNIITATLPGPATAIGMNFGGLFSGGIVDFMLTFSDGSTVNASTTQSIGGGSLDFIGVTSTVALTSVQITMPDTPYYNAIDNFSVGLSAVPEPSTMATAGLAVLLCGGFSWRRRGHLRRAA